MSFLSLIFKQMRQRALSTWLTTLSVLLGVALAISTLILHREGDKLFGQTEFGTAVLIGPKASKLQLVLSTFYQLDLSPGTIRYDVYRTLPDIHSGRFRWALPIAEGDTFKGQNIYGTLPKLFDPKLTGDAPTRIAAIREAMRPDQNKTPGKVGVMAAVFQGDADAATRLDGLLQDLEALHEAAVIVDPEAGEIIESAEKQLRSAKQELAEGHRDHATTAMKDAYAAVLRAGPMLNAFEVRPGRSTISGSISTYTPGESVTLREGRVFDRRKFEAVVGSEAARVTGLKVGDTFKATHGGTDPNAPPDDDHNETWTVVGIANPTRTSFDRIIFIPLASFYAIPAHEKALENFAKIKTVDSIDTPKPTTTAAHDEHDDHEHDEGDHDEPGHEHHHHEHAYHLDEHGRIVLHLAPDKLKLNAILAGKLSEAGPGQMMSDINNAPDAMAVSPAQVAGDFFRTFFSSWSTTLLVFALLVSVVAAIGILVSVYNSIAARRREIAILRALGATRMKILSLICCEAAVVGLLGGVAGLVAAHAMAGVGAKIVRERAGVDVQWLTVGSTELLYLAGVVLLSAIAGLVPAAKAYQTDVASNLAAE